MRSQNRRRVNRQWNDEERAKHGQQVASRFATERKQKLEILKKAISYLEDQGISISQNEVARVSGISVGFVNKHFRDQVGLAREKQLNKLSNKSKSMRKLTSDSNELERLKLINKKLRRELNEKKDLLREVLAQAAHVVELEDEVGRLKQQAQELISALQSNKGKVVPIHTDKLYPNVFFARKTQDNNREFSGISQANQSRIIDALRDMGIKPNSTLSNAISHTPEPMVWSAIDALKQAMSSTNIRHPGGWLLRAIQEGWKTNDSFECQQNLDELAFFKRWFELALKKRIFIASNRSEDGKLYVYDAEGVPTSFEDACKLFPIEDLS